MRQRNANRHEFQVSGFAPFEVGVSIQPTDKVPDGFDDALDGFRGCWRAFFRQGAVLPVVDHPFDDRQIESGQWNVFLAFLDFSDLEEESIARLLYSTFWRRSPIRRFYPFGVGTQSR